MSKSLDRQIIATLAYSSQFGCPLTADELTKRLISIDFLDNFFGEQKDELQAKSATKSATTGDLQLKNKPELKQVKKRLLYLVKQGEVYQDEEYFFVGSERMHASNKERERRRRKSKIFRKEIPELLSVLASVPFVKGAALTGSLAVDNAVKSDDIDLLVVTAPNTLWLSRLSIMLLLWKKGRRVSSEKLGKIGWCFNLWLEADNLSISPEKRSIFTAYEVCQADWIYDLQEVRANWLSANQWVKRFVPSFFDDCCRQTKQPVRGENQLPQPYSNQASFFKRALLIAINSGIYLLQKAYLRLFTGIPLRNLGYKQVYLHKLDSSRRILHRWQKKLQKL